MHHLWTQDWGIHHVLPGTNQGWGWRLESLRVKGARSHREVKAKALSAGSMRGRGQMSRFRRRPTLWRRLESGAWGASASSLRAQELG